jgi:hypothetical protein
MAASVAFSAGVSVSRTVMSRKQRSRNTHRVTPVVRINGRTPYTAINIRTHTKTAAFFNNVSDKNSYSKLVSLLVCVPETPSSLASTLSRIDRVHTAAPRGQS